MAFSDLMSFPLTEMRIGLTEEFCVGKSELRGEETVGLSLLGIGHCQRFGGEKLETDPHPTPPLLFSPRIWVRRGVFLSLQVMGREFG